ncbi:MAG: GerMN domain-containing protein [Meiothermus sp.]|uniref:GerMN domain-containing protein n=1 Tax=Meiothermus sp. TaxID=1955249 RepID=UPI0025D56E29|nr:GerMN domain-containing protein [Meiothermus sp.]MCS7058310.1 GerMN domain-containing protein [Meiothermus sp.]MCS7194809.1 GerMN domain-containing protein [Meiothermus sp.]MCX7740986.1 GerMN domain-containing protein [Meiothermus sp.]MDW8090341.1 GerMN domain-containing protein [Meiothermus sp.]MDW8481159.1 GerMN domain-containing protein [Meiothermus sp.]
MKGWLSLTNLVGLLVLLLGVLALWATQESSEFKPLNLPSGPQVQDHSTRTLRLYFAKDAQDGLVVEERTIQVAEGEYLLGRALEELVKGPQLPGAAPLVPAGTPAPTVFLRDGTAIVDLPSAYGGLGFGAAGETLLIYGIANTLLEFKEVQQVRFLLAGQEVESLGHLSLLDPFKRP